MITAGLPASLAGPQVTLDEAREPGEFLLDGDLAGSVRAAAQLQGQSLPAPPAVDGPVQALSLMSQGYDAELPPEQAWARVPAEAKAPLGRLLVAMAQADQLIDEANQGATLEDLMERLAGHEGWTGIVQTTSGQAAEPAPTLDMTKVERQDVGAYTQALAIMLDAIEETRPELAQLTAHTCSPVDLRPYLLVCQSGDDTYDSTDNAILILDLEGDDTYANAQGSPWGGLGLPQVIIDLSGSDTYVRTAQASSGTVEAIGQGAGVLGLGGILDVKGDDRYINRATFSGGLGGDLVHAVSIAQGAGSLGAGFLIDAGGRDCVEAISRARGGTATTVAQGAGVLGAGLAVLAGQTEDPADPNCASGPTAKAIGQDLILRDTPNDYVADLGLAFLTAQGAGGGPLYGPTGLSLHTGGIGLLLGSVTSQAYTAASSGGFAVTTAQGAGQVGAGVLADPAGADTFEATADIDVRLQVIRSGSYLGVQTFTYINLGDTVAVAQGAGFREALGIHTVANSQGRTYETRASTYAEATSISETTLDSGRAYAESIVQVGRTLAAGQGDGDRGIGIITETGPIAGDDVRRMTSSLEAHSTAIAEGGIGPTATATTTTENADADGQGLGVLGVGALTDAGGSDLYNQSASLDATATQSPGQGTLEPGRAAARGQAQAGNTAGLGGLVDVVGQDTYQQSPGATAAGQDQCWTNSPPGISQGNLRIGIGLDALSGQVAVPAGCVPVPN